MNIDINNSKGICLKTKYHYFNDNITLTPTSEPVTITKNGTFEPQNSMIFSNITVNVPQPKLADPIINDQGDTVVFQKGRAFDNGSFPITYVVNGSPISGSYIYKSNYYDMGNVFVLARSPKFIDSESVYVGNWTKPVGPPPPPDPGGGGDKCLTSDTLILMADGTQKPLGTIKSGDSILAYGWNYNELRPLKVLYSSNDDPTVEFVCPQYQKRTFGDGTVITNAYSHRFYNATQKAFVHLPKWNIGDLLLKADGTLTPLEKVETVYEPCHYTRITTEFEGTNYFAAGALCGDSECPGNLDLDQLQFPWSK